MPRGHDLDPWHGNGHGWPVEFGLYPPKRLDSAYAPTGYASQWWVHPSGCEYSRAGRPGEIVWYVIINSIGRKKCPRLIVQQANDGAYDGLSNLN